MTKKEYFEIIKTKVAEDKELVAFIDKELELLEKRNSANAKAKAEKAEKDAVITEEVINFLTANANTPMTTMEIGSAVGISPQKATPILKRLVAEEKVVLTTEKRKNLYSVA